MPGDGDQVVLVTAANGNQGRLLVPKLLAAGVRVRASVTSEASAERLREIGVEDVVVGDLSEPEVVHRAVHGVDRIYHVGPTLHPRERDIGLAVVDAAVEHGVRYLVLSSVLHAITTDLVQPMPSSAVARDDVDHSPIPCLSRRPPIGPPPDGRSMPEMIYACRQRLGDPQILVPRLYRTWSRRCAPPGCVTSTTRPGAARSTRPMRRTTGCLRPWW
ncbi:SDR family oxidoreductase [Angustibacter speluncae]